MKNIEWKTRGTTHTAAYGRGRVQVKPFYNSLTKRTDTYEVFAIVPDPTGRKRELKCSSFSDIENGLDAAKTYAIELFEEQFGGEV